ncbi:hypothetical protein [Fischerella muscicola]|uniref:hypothetical protein n=1 Tax=Fischerella muscicola TaxID=92938 RepID=UPI0011AF01FE|nr:hypothetical protein [Fischerella muscicola]
MNSHRFALISQPFFMIHLMRSPTESRTATPLFKILIPSELALPPPFSPAMRFTNFLPSSLLQSRLVQAKIIFIF